MALPNEQSLLITRAEEASYQRVSRDLKLRNQIFTGLGGATVFGLVSAITSNLIPASTSLLSLGAILPVAGIAIVGMGCLYLASKYFSESVSLDQDISARKIQAAANKDRAVAQETVLATEATQAQQAAVKTPGMGAQGFAAEADHAGPAAQAADAPRADWAERTPRKQRSMDVLLARSDNGNIPDWGAKVRAEQGAEGGTALR